MKDMLESIAKNEEFPVFLNLYGRTADGLWGCNIRQHGMVAEEGVTEFHADPSQAIILALVKYIEQEVRGDGEDSRPEEVE